MGPRTSAHSHVESSQYACTDIRMLRLIGSHPFDVASAVSGPVGLLVAVATGNWAYAIFGGLLMVLGLGRLCFYAIGEVSNRMLAVLIIAWLLSVGALAVGMSFT